MPAPNDDRPIRILHLSDIHFKADKAWDADPVLRALVRFIAKEVNDGLAPDLVAITGDLAFAGVAKEYRLARDWLDQQLWPALPKNLSRDRLLLVPGNHDVDRKKVDFVAEAVQKNLLIARYCSHEILAHRAIHLIWTAARNDFECLAYLVAMPRPLFRCRNAFSTRWRSL